jgi:hypothetical protein
MEKDDNKDDIVDLDDNLFDVTMPRQPILNVAKQ